MDKTSSFENSCDNLSQGPKPVNDQAGEGKKHLVKAAGVMGVMTLLSRLLGMVRDIVSARAFGTTWQLDAFLYAFMIPNFFRRIIGEGGLNSAFVPIYGEILQKKNREEAFKFANIMLTLMIAAFAGILLVIEAVLALCLESGAFPPRIELILDLLRFFFPYLALMSISALWMGVLNSHRHFFGAAFSPVVLNVVWIVGTLWVTVFADRGQAYQLRILAGIMLFAGVIQMAVEWPSLIKIGYRARWIWNRTYPEVSRVFSLLMPVMMGFAAMQINLMIDMTLSFWIGPGANSSLYYGNRLMQLPLGLFAVGMGTALLPAIANHITAGKTDLAKKNLSFAMRSIFLLVLPCSAGLIALSTPIVRFLFERGEFDAESTRRTAQVLLCYSIGLFAHSGLKIVTTGFHASQDTKTPVRSTMIALAVNLVFNLILMWPLKEAGLALATTISGIVQFFHLFIVFHRRTFNLPLREISISFARIFAASAVMALFAVFFYRFMEGYLPGGELFAQGVRLFSTMTLSALIYFICCFLFRAEEVHATAAWIFKRKKLRAAGE